MSALHRFSCLCHLNRSTLSHSVSWRCAALLVFFFFLLCLVWIEAARWVGMCAAIIWLITLRWWWKIHSKLFKYRARPTETRCTFVYDKVFALWDLSIPHRFFSCTLLLDHQQLDFLFDSCWCQCKKLVVNAFPLSRSLFFTLRLTCAQPIMILLCWLDSFHPKPNHPVFRYVQNFKWTFSRFAFEIPTHPHCLLAWCRACANKLYNSLLFSGWHRSKSFFVAAIRW